MDTTFKTKISQESYQGFDIVYSMVVRGSLIEGDLLNRRKAFTLVEILTVVVVAAILARLAIPSYVNYTQRARLAEIVRLVGKDSKIYASLITDLGLPSSQAAADNLLTREPLSVCESEAVDSSLLSGASATCGFTSFGITVRTDTASLPLAVIYFTPTIVGDVINWRCSYGTSTSSEGIAILPARCSTDFATSGVPTLF